MPLIRIVVLLILIAALLLLLAQNWFPVPLVFLGMRTQLPLAIWILLSVTSGMFTSLLITSLFKLSNYFATLKLNRQRDAEAKPKSSQQRGASTNRPPTQTSTSSSDWDSEPIDNDWVEDTAPQKSGQDSRKTYNQPEPEPSPQSGSYSFSYQSKAKPRTESVYDADYRVVTPPEPPKKTVKPQDDWGFFEDEED